MRRSNCEGKTEQSKKLPVIELVFLISKSHILSQGDVILAWIAGNQTTGMSAVKAILGSWVPAIHAGTTIIKTFFELVDDS